MTRSPPVKAPGGRPKRKPRGSFHHGDLREAVILLAETDVEQSGHSALSINDIARRLGVTGPAVYRHFSDRSALLHEVGQRGFMRFEAKMTSLVEQEPNVWTRLSAVGHGYVSYAMANPGWFRLQFLSHSDDRPAVDLERTPPRYREELVEALTEALGDHLLAIDAYRALWGLVHGLATGLVAESFGRDSGTEMLQERVTKPLNVFIAGLKALAPTK